MDIARIATIDRIKPFDFAMELFRVSEEMQGDMLDVEVQSSFDSGLVSALVIGMKRYSIEN